MDVFRILSTVALLFVAGIVVAANTADAANDADRSPLALALTSDRTVCLTANHTGGSVSLVDLAAGRVLAELAVGSGPADVAWINDSTALVSLLHDDAVAVVSRTGNTLKLTRKIPVGDDRRGLALS